MHSHSSERNRLQGALASHPDKGGDPEERTCVACESIGLRVKGSACRRGVEGFGRDPEVIPSSVLWGFVLRVR